MIKSLTAALVLIMCIHAAWSQEQGAYWQQKVDYRISVILADEDHMLYGKEELTYSNHSPDTLEYLIFHLWPNAYSSKRTALANQLLRSGNTSLAFATPEEMGHIDSLAFALDGKACLWEYDPKHVDICTLFLEKPLLPNEEVKVSTPFRVKLPSGKISRLGHLGQSYQITQWYPKPAVYDQNGWHPMPYLNQGEFYSEFGSFDVEITLPANYTVGATGDLQTDSERQRLLELAQQTEAWLKKRESKDDSPDGDDAGTFPESEEKMKTLRFYQEQVHDFAWFADKRYRVLRGNVRLPESKDSVEVWTMFTDQNAEVWKESIEYMKDAIYYYSLWNGNYPYKQATAVDGTISAGGGMEYPNVTVIGTMGTPYLLETVIMHEVGHNWFYGILGSNERDYPWMDEGLNSYNESRYLNTKYPKAIMFIGNRDLALFDKIGLSNYRPADSHYFTYLLSARANKDQTHEISSDRYEPLNYGAIVYSKSAVVFYYLKEYLGDEKMDEVMHAYFEKFKFKHPYPEDFRMVAEKVSGEDLSWLFDELLGTTEKIDYAVKKAKLKDGKTYVLLKNKGGINGPVPLSLMEGEQEQKLWLDGFERDTTLRFEDAYDRVEIDSEWMVPEINRQNNYSDTKGVLKRVEPLQVSMLSVIENPRKTQLHYLPVVGANVPSGIMPGLLLYNSTIPVKKLNYYLMPMFSTKAITLTGSMDAYYMFTPVGSSFESIDLGINGKRHVSQFGYELSNSIAYNRLEPYIRFDFKPFRPNGFWDHELTLSAVVTEMDTLAVAEGISVRDVFYRTNYTVDFDHPIYKTTFTGRGELHEQFVRGSIEILNKINIYEKVEIRSRVFGGYFFSNNSNDPRFNWRMDGQFGRTDYAFDHLLLDRSRDDNLMGRQMTETHGAFKVRNATGQSNLALLAYNIEVKPKRIPLAAFADAGYNFSGNMLYDAGLALNFLNGFFKVYAPLVVSQDIERENDTNGRELLDLIRFQIRFNAANLMEIRRKLDL